MNATCSKCGKETELTDAKVPTGRSYFICGKCKSRINVFKGFQQGSQVTNTVGLRFMRNGEGFHQEYCEPGGLWRVEKVRQPCPYKGEDKSCEEENRGRCPNQLLVLRLERDSALYGTCMYRNGRKIFDKTYRSPLGVKRPVVESEDDDTTRRVR